MKITILGTGTSVGVPMIGCDCHVCRSNDPHDKRLRTSAYIETSDANFCIDTGPDFRQQMLRHQITRLDAAIFTHSHQDHIAGLDDTRAFSTLQGKPFRIYADENVQIALQRAYYYVFDPAYKYPGGPEIEVRTIIHPQTFSIGDTDIIPISLIHGNTPILGFRINDFTYITDASRIAPAEQSKIKGTKTLVINALRHKRHWSHFSLHEAIEMIDRLQPDRAYLTHLSHQIGTHAELEAQLPAHIRPAYDGLIINH